MNTILERTVFTLEVKKSKFIGIILPLNSENEVKMILSNIKNEYKDARHYTYAYIFDNNKRMSDDKEPSKTAGSPILNVLEKNNLNRVILIVVRYFGGILLGAPGLTRAYSNTALETVKAANVVPFVLYNYYLISFSYDYIKDIDYMLSDDNIISKEFLDSVNYKIKLESDFDLEKLKKYAQIKKITL